MLDFHGKVVFLTGGSGGIGTRTVELLVERGAKVISTDVAFPSRAPAEMTFEKNPVELGLDVRDPKRVRELIDLTVDKCMRLDIVVNAAGVVSTTPILEIQESDWDNVFATNLKGTFFVCQAALGHMIQRKAGCIVNISSIAGKLGGILSGADYSTSKAAVICLTKCLAKAGAPYGVRVNSIAPGFIHTTMIDPYYERFPDRMDKTVDAIPFKRLGEATEVASTILFLASEEASYVTGTCVDVDGGVLMD